MELKGNILRIKNKRDNQHRDIEIHVDKIEYITHKKDGRFYQAFDYVDILDTPLIITGDCLSRAPKTDFEAEDYVFHVFDKIGDTYILNENKRLVLTLVYVEEAEQTILNTGTYSVTVSNEEFDQIKRDRSKEKKSNKRKVKKKG
jgi:hypothetical protein